MKILIYGAGVIGRIYASRLHESGCDVTLLARGRAYENLKQNGVIIKDVLTGKQTIRKVPLTEQLLPDDFYDLIIVTVRLDQIDSVVPVLKDNNVSPLVMLMLNYPEDIKQLTKELNNKHIILGFPGAGGIYENNCVSYIQIKQQKTTIGELNGEVSAYIKEIKENLETAWFGVETSPNMQAWLKIHAVFVSCISAAISLENGDSIQLGKNRSSVKMMVESIREGFAACKALGLPILPANLKTIFMIMPKWFSILYWQKAMQSEIGTLSLAPHANAAKVEMQLLAKKVLTIVHSSPLPTPTLDKLLLGFINGSKIGKVG